ncbi:MAG TPA: hypothetical protein VJ201_04965 [Candidatus Babeliales bacterium]|nr:hypothetical protein [Candidatus Babeliales bacterium]
MLNHDSKSMRLEHKKTTEISYKYRLIIFFMSIVLISSCRATMVAHDQDSDWITIFIHGTIMPHLSLNSLIKILKDKMERSAYALATEFIRNDPFFYQNQAIAQLGLHPIEDQLSVAYLFAQVYDKLGTLGQDSNIKTRYYTYGWSGLLSSRSRKQEAHTFYNSLANELIVLRERHQFPKIRIVAYSHGANLVLNLAEVEKCFTPLYPLEIDELICIGLPIQSSTQALVNAAMFKKIYNIYSLYDNVQKIDFASRRFPSNFTPQNLTQIKVRIFGGYDNKKKTYRRERMDPGHIELWFFGWSTKYYRKKFPLYPLPFSVTLQWLINQINEHALVKDSIEASVNFIKETIDLRCYRSTRKGTVVVPFISRFQIEEIKQFAQQIKPDKKHYSRQLHDKRRKWARLQAAQVKRILKRVNIEQAVAESRYRRRPVKLCLGHCVTRAKGHNFKKSINPVSVQSSIKFTHTLLNNNLKSDIGHVNKEVQY